MSNYDRDTSSYVGTTAFGQEVDAEFSIDEQATNTLKEWSGRTKLIAQAGGSVEVRNPVMVDGDAIRRRVFRWGFLEEAIAVDGEIDRALKVVGLSDLGVLRLAHVEAMARDGAGEVVLDRLWLLRIADKWALSGGNIEVLMKLPADDGDTPISFAVPGYIPMGVISALGGDSGIGKSTLAHDLALLVGTPPEHRDPERTWLGVPAADIAHGTAVYLSGEEPSSFVSARRKSLGSHDSSHIFELSLDGEDPEALLDGAMEIPNLALLVVDPARSFYKGDENDSAVVDAALARIGRFAAKAGCAALVVHHTTKAAHPRNPDEVIDALRGSGTFKARVRSAIGMLQKGGLTLIGVPKHNVPRPYTMQEETRAFRLQDGAPRLMPVVQGDRPPAMAEVDEGVGRVVRALTAAVGRGERVTATGPRGVYESKLVDLAGMSRKALRDAVQAARAAGAIEVNAASDLVPAGLTGVAVVAASDSGNAAIGA